MKTLSLLVDSAEKLANDPKAPAALVDWASMVYDQLIDGEAKIDVRHLRMLSVLSDDYEQGLTGASYILSTIHIPGLSGMCARQDDDEQWREKLVALLEGLECGNKREHPNLDMEDLIAHGKVEDYQKLGKRILCRLRLLRKFLEEDNTND